jgi:hypothetical protein
MKFSSVIAALVAGAATAQGHSNPHLLPYPTANEQAAGYTFTRLNKTDAVSDISSFLGFLDARNQS